jgi:glucuronoarabinoxylan endo-1,4-beta-xylanase
MKSGRLIIGVLAIAVSGVLSFTAAIDVSLNPSLRYQTIDGFGAFGTGDYNKAVNDMGMTIHRGGAYGYSYGPHDFLKQTSNLAKANGDQMKLFISVWTPPGDMKEGPFYSGGCSDGANMCGGILSPSKYEAFGNYLAKIADDYKAAGIPLYAISPQNEPWLPMWYVSCTYDQIQYRNMLRVVGPILAKRHPELKIIAAEMFLSASSWEMNSFLRDSSGQYVDILARHGYTVSGAGVSLPGWKAYAAMNAYANTGRKREVWMTEQSNYAESWEATAQNGIYAMALDIYMLLKYGNGSGWVWWKLSGGGGVGGSTEGLMNGGNPEKKSYYCLKQYARYIRPGAVRIEASMDTAKGIYSAAFHHPVKKQLSVVVINAATAGQEVTLTGNKLPASMDWYLTNGSKNCEKQASLTGTSKSLTIPARSLVTLMGDNYIPDITATAVVAAGYKRNSRAGAASKIATYNLIGKKMGTLSQGASRSVCIQKRTDGSLGIELHGNK